MAINASGGMAKVRANKLGQLKKQKERREALEKQQGRNDEGEDFEDDELEEGISTRLGRFMVFIDPFIAILIVINAIQMGMATFNFVEDNAQVDRIFEIIDQVFLIIFSVEVSLNFIHHVRLDRMTIIDHRITFLPRTIEEEEIKSEDRSWLIFDALVVILSWSFAQLSIVRAFRILRLLRLIKKVESLKNVVGSLLSVMPKMGVIAFMLSVCFLVFGIAFTDMFGDLYEQGYTEYDYFGSLDGTFFTLFQIMTFDSWQGVARSTMARYPYSWILFILWNLITGFVIMNLIIAVICESLVKLTEKKKREQEALVKEQRKIEGVNITNSRKILDDGSSMHTLDYFSAIEDRVQDIMLDQEVMMETVQELKVALRDVLDNSPKSNDIRSILNKFPSVHS
jgi:hypothetical protein